MDLLITVVTPIINIFLGMFAYLKNPKSTTHRLLAFLAFQISIWAIFNYLSLHQPTESLTLLWIRIDMLPGAFMGPTIYLLVRNFPNAKINTPKWMLVFFAVLILATMVVAMSPYMFVDAVFEGSNIRAIPGPGIALFGINFVGSLILAFITSIQRYRQSVGFEKIQLKFLVLGLAGTFSLIALTQFFFVVLFHTSFFIRFGPVYSVILVGSITYAIVKHRFLDIRLLVARTVTFSIIIFIVVSGYIALIYTFTLLIPGIGISSRQAMVFASISIVLFFISNTLTRVVRIVTDKIFFQDRYDPEELLAKLTNLMASEIDIRLLSNHLLATINRDMRLVHSGFIVYDKKGAKLEVEQDNGLKSEFGIKDEDLFMLREIKEPLIFDEMTEGTEKTFMREHNISIFMPLSTKEGGVGYLALGAKASGDIYNSTDIDVLKIFGKQAAVALQNALAYLEIQEFSRTLEKKVEERTAELKKSQESELAKARELLKLKDEFVFIATHDLRTPVTAIEGYITLIEDEKPKFSAEVESNFEAVREASERLKQLVNDLLQVARSESGTIKVSVAPLEIHKVIDRVLRELKHVALEKRVELRTNIDQNHSLVMADEEKLYEVFENLMSNAVKFNKPDGSVTVTTAKANNMLEIKVSDTGHGIPKAEQAHVFQKFFKYRGDTTRDVPGTGLGLFVVRMLIEKMGGTIDFASVEEQGTTFRFTLPLAT